jgi:sigma-E factor negative regulatory protein RseA
LTRKFQTYALSAAASVAAVAVVGWVTLTTVIPNTAITANTPATLTQGIAPQPAPQLAAAPGAATQQAAALPAPVPKPAVQTAAAPAEPMQEYLLAHQGISPTTAFQGVTPYIRTVSSSDE